MLIDATAHAARPVPIALQRNAAKRDGLHAA
jgi:hypothetical protein